ncbi:LrgB family protein [Grimontia hollisae]|uniref:LrgB family protein n=1 Tax=Grimontia hollisae TaxID=673 RepID=UPI0013032D9A|nr:LrgB family protein [Grimontia hollisae]
MWMLATLIVYFLVRQIALRFRHPIFNPLLMSLMVLMPWVIYSGDSYQTYFEQNKAIHFMLGPAVIALAYPLYEQLHVIRRHWKTILVACTCSSLASMMAGVFFALWTGGSMQIAASVLPKSISTPFALSTAANIGGIPAVTAALVVVAGLFGALIGYPLLNLLNVKSTLARGLSIGAVSHAIGTAKAAESNYQEGAMSSLALVICGIITTILAPFVFTLIELVIGHTTI